MSRSPLPTQGLRELMAMKKHVQSEQVAESKSSKYVKVRFTRKQYEAFRNACSILEVVSGHAEFDTFVQLALDAKVKSRIISQQLIHPIVTAPTKIVDNARTPASQSPKVTYFTAQIQPTDTCKALYSRIADSGDIKTRYDIRESDITCITDIRLMIGRYIAINHLKTPEGTIVDDFLQSIAFDTLNTMKHEMLNINGKLIIPRHDKKIVIRMVNEIAVSRSA